MSNISNQQKQVLNKLVNVINIINDIPNKQKENKAFLSNGNVTYADLLYLFKAFQDVVKKNIPLHPEVIPSIFIKAIEKLPDNYTNKQTLLNFFKKYPKFKKLNNKNINNKNKQYLDTIKRFFDELNKPKVFVLINPYNKRKNKQSNFNVKTLLNSIKSETNIELIKTLSPLNEVKKVASEGMKFNFVNKNVPEGKPTALIMIGASGAGKTTVIKQIIEKWKNENTRGKMTRIIIKPLIKIRASSGVSTISFQETTKENTQNQPIDLIMKEFETSHARPTPFNDKSSRAHHLFKFGEGEYSHIIGDLCGTESASDISMNCFGIDIFTSTNLKIFQTSTTFVNLHEDIKKLYMSFIPKQQQQQLQWTNLLSKVSKETVSEDADTQKYISSIAISLLVLLHSKKAKKANSIVREDLGTKVVIGNKPGKNMKNKAFNTLNALLNVQTGQFFKMESIPLMMQNEYEKKPAYVYVANVIMRCLESMWISRTLDELSTIYNTNKRSRNWATSYTYHVPLKMIRENDSSNFGKYIINTSDFKKNMVRTQETEGQVSQTPFALGTRNSGFISGFSAVKPTPVSSLIRILEPNVLKTNVTDSSRLHRLFIVIGHTGGKALNQKHRLTLKRLKSLVPGTK